jgi:hypothetical protein
MVQVAVDFDSACTPLDLVPCPTDFGMAAYLVGGVACPDLANVEYAPIEVEGRYHARQVQQPMMARQ